MARTPVSIPHTKAWTVLGRNLDSISHMLALGTREIALVETAAIRRYKTPIGDLTKATARAKKDYPVGLAPRLELIWGIRHVTVHAAGVATADFLKRHPGAAGAVGDRVRVNSRQFQAFFEVARAFLEPTERFFLARYPSLLASTASERVK